MRLITTKAPAFAIFLASSLALVPGAIAAPVTIDFDSLPVATIVTNQYPGVTFSIPAPIPGPRTYALQTTSGIPVNIFGASGNAITPGDNVGSINPPFYDITIQFAQSVDYFSIMVLDAEERVVGNAYSGADLVQSVVQGNFIGFFSSPVFNGPVYKLELGSVGGPLHFDRVLLDLTEADGPEVYDNVVYNPVPEPNSLALITLALAATGVAGCGYKWRSPF